MAPLSTEAKPATPALPAFRLGQEAVLALILVFVGSKIFLVGIIGKIPPVFSLSVTLTLLAGGVLFSLWKTRNEPPLQLQAGASK